MCQGFHSFVSNPDDLISPLGVCNVCVLIAHSLPFGSVCNCPSHTHARGPHCPSTSDTLCHYLTISPPPRARHHLLYTHTSIDAARYIQAHTYSPGFVCANTLSQQIMIELWVTAPMANSRRGGRKRGGAGGGLEAATTCPMWTPGHRYFPQLPGLVWSSLMFILPSIFSFSTHHLLLFYC